MPIKLTYVIKESVNNLRRNILMTAAALLTVIISLALAGAALLFRAGVDNATTQFKGGFDISVIMKPEATKDQIDAIGRELKNMPELKKIEFRDQNATFADIKRLFRNDPATLSSYSGPQDAPTEWRIKPKNPEQIEAIGARFLKRAGVFDVAYARAVKLILSVTSKIQLVILCIAAALLVSAVVLILNTIRMAIFARRREVAVMKLVGATNTFIRLPFMVEGMLQGLVGAGLGFGLVALGTAWAQSSIRHSSVTLLKQMAVTSSQILSTGVVMLVVGALAGAIGSALAVSRFLDA